MASGLVEPDGGHRETSFLGQVGQVGGDEGRGSRQGQGAPALAQDSKARQAEAYMARVLSETLESRERRSRTSSAVVRPAAGAGAVESFAGAGISGFCRAISGNLNVSYNGNYRTCCTVSCKAVFRPQAVLSSLFWLAKFLHGVPVDRCPVGYVPEAGSS